MTTEDQEPVTAPDSAAVTAMIVSLRHLHLAHARLRTRAARTVGISLRELNALAFVVEQDGITPKDLSHELGLAPGTVTAIADRLEALGYVHRERKSDDRRSLVLAATAEGLATVATVVEHFSDSIATYVSEGDTDEMELVRRYLDGLSIVLLKRSDEL